MAISGTIDVGTINQWMAEIGKQLPRPSLFVSPKFRSQLVAEFHDAQPTISPSIGPANQSFMGLNVRTFDIPPRQVFDWSGCRSPARAKRRHAQGKPQRVKITYEEVAYLMPSEDLDCLNLTMERKAEEMLMMAYRWPK